MYQRQATFSEAINSALKEHYCDFNGRASRSQFWWFQLFTCIISACLSSLFINFKVLDMVTASNIIYAINGVVGLVLLLPTWGLAVRRLHDINKSGWWLLIGFIPLIGGIVLLIWFCKESDMTPNQYGEVPYLTDK